MTLSPHVAAVIHHSCDEIADVSMIFQQCWSWLTRLGLLKDHSEFDIVVKKSFGKVKIPKEHAILIIAKVFFFTNFDI